MSTEKSSCAPWESSIIRHGRTLLHWFRLNQKEWNIRVHPELRVQVASTRFRVPDVTVLDRSRPIEQIITYPPLAVFEVLSPEDTVRRLKRKLRK